MSITDELREYALGWDERNRVRRDLRAIADRIDAAVKGMVELPKDADDVPWRIGDRDEDGNVVTQLRLSSDGWYAVTDGPSAFHPDQRRHYHAPTVEDVLTEMVAKVIERGELTNGAAQTIAEYAKRLTLAEGEDA